MAGIYTTWNTEGPSLPLAPPTRHSLPTNTPDGGSYFGSPAWIKRISGSRYYLEGRNGHDVVALKRKHCRFVKCVNSTTSKKCTVSFLSLKKFRTLCISVSPVVEQEWQKHLPTSWCWWRLKKIFSIFHVHVPTWVYVPHVYAVPTEPRRGCQISCNQSYRRLWATWYGW